MGKRQVFERSVMSWHELATDRVLLNGLEWITARGAATLVSLQAEVDAFASTRGVPA